MEFQKVRSLAVIRTQDQSGCLSLMLESRRHDFFGKRELQSQAIYMKLSGSTSSSSYLSGNHFNKDISTPKTVTDIANNFTSL